MRDSFLQQHTLYPIKPWAHLYKRARWLRLRRSQLDEHPLCCMCEEDGHLCPATIVDHKRPHHGDETLFFDEGNLQSLCKMHHDGEKKRQEHREGQISGCDAQGSPIDPAHHWNSASLSRAEGTGPPAHRGKGTRGLKSATGDGGMREGTSCPARAPDGLAPPIPSVVSSPEDRDRVGGQQEYYLA